MEQPALQMRSLFTTCLLLSCDQFGQNYFPQRVELRRASEQAGFSNRHFVEQLPEFCFPVRSAQ